MERYFGQLRQSELSEDEFRELFFYDAFTFDEWIIYITLQYDLKYVPDHVWSYTETKSAGFFIFNLN